MRRAGLVIGMLIFVAAGAAAQDAPLVPGDRAANDELVKIVESIKQSGLPVDPILNRVSYGVNIAHAPAARIVAAARDIAARLPVARDALAPGATALDIASGEGALSNGATPQSLRAIRAAGGRQSLAAALGVLAQLVASGIPADAASKTVVAFMKRGATGEQLAVLGNGVTFDVAAGARALSALDVRSQGLNAVLAQHASAGVFTGAAALPLGPKKP